MLAAISVFTSVFPYSVLAESMQNYPGVNKDGFRSRIHTVPQIPDMLLNEANRPHNLVQTN